MNTRHRTASAALVATLVLAACGSTADTATSDTATSDGGAGRHGGGHGASSNPPVTEAAGHDADIAFLTGMRPHHRQAVEMSDMVLARTPPAAVAELARQVKAAQDPEVEQMDEMLADLGQRADSGSHGDDHSGGHGGMMTDAQMSALMDAEGANAARLYLTGMIEHHEGAIQAAEVELKDGKHEPARQLARDIAKAQAAEITKMQKLLQTL